MAEENGAYERLPVKRRRFVDEYVGAANGNASEAARRAGYSHPGQLGYRLAKDPAVRAAVEERLDELSMPSVEILARLTEQARALYALYIRNENGKAAVDLAGLEAAGLNRLIKKISYDPKGKQVIEFHDVQHALELLGRHRRLFVDRAELSGPNGGKVPVGISFEEALAELRAVDAGE